MPGKSLAVPEDATLDREAEDLCTLIDISRCVGCEACVDACREANAHKFPEPEKPFPEMFPARVKVSDWSERRDVRDRLTPYNWLFIQHTEIEYRGEVHYLTIPRRCMHCVNPPCANLCPWGAARKRRDGVVQINPEVCLGGSKCKSVCPWDIPQRQTGVGLYLRLLPRFVGNGVMYKCDRCADRVAKGLLPACIEACPYDVQTIGPRSRIVAKARQLAAEQGRFVYGDLENGGTNTIYLSPVPFELISRASPPKDGRPSFKRYPNMLASEKKLAYAMAAAPVAGIAAGLLAAGRSIAKDIKKKKDESE